MKTHFLLVAIALQIQTNVRALGFKYPFQNPSLSWDVRVDDLVSRLTLEEIVDQTYTGPTPAIPRLGIQPYVWSTECIRGQVLTNTTTFPQSIGLAASFSKELLYAMAEAISTEVRAHWNGNKAQGIYQWEQGLSCFSPVINIMRHPLWGRNQETYGECPYLSGELVAHYVRGLQGNDPRYVRANAGCKHFDVHGGPENIPVSRFSFDAKVSMRDWRMTFLPQFKKCVEAGTYSLMCSFNSINGVPACANKQLLRDILRKEWGFNGYIVSDSGAIEDFIYEHKYVNTSVDAATVGIKAGCNLELQGNHHIYKSQIEAMKQGKLNEEDLRANVRPLMYTRLRLGEFDPPTMVPYNNIDMSVVQSLKHRELAIRAATNTFVLLKNEGNLLPLTKHYGRIAIVGPMADNTEQLFGSYTSNIETRYTQNVQQGLSGLADDPMLAMGCSSTACTDYNSGEIYGATSEAELIVVALGTGQQLEEEANDRATLDLPGSQLQLLKDAATFGVTAPVILLLFNAGPLDISWAKDSPRVSVIMACFFPAQSTGQALYHSLTLSGDMSGPAGRLPATWPTSLNQVPAITDYSMQGHTYRYYQGEPLYPFGYGLSYTTFKYSLLSVHPQVVIPGQSVYVEVQVQNIGKHDSHEVVQLYMSWPKNSSGIPVPKLQLVEFARPWVKIMETVTLKFVIKGEQMAVWLDDDQGFGFIPGLMTVYAGGQQPNQQTNVGSNVLQTTFILSHELPVNHDIQHRKPPQKKETA